MLAHSMKTPHARQVQPGEIGALVEALTGIEKFVTISANQLPRRAVKRTLLWLSQFRCVRIGR
jgi:hypothetical protein